MKDVLCFLNEFDFVDKLDNLYLENVDENKRLVVGEFEDYNISKLIYVLKLIDEKKLSDLTNDLDHCLERTDSLRSNFFL